MWCQILRQFDEIEIVSEAQRQLIIAVVDVSVLNKVTGRHASLLLNEDIIFYCQRDIDMFSVQCGLKNVIENTVHFPQCIAFIQWAVLYRQSCWFLVMKHILIKKSSQACIFMSCL